jgi:hypothetical protein
VRTHISGGSGKSRKPRRMYCKKTVEHASLQRLFGRESMMNDGASVSGSATGSEAKAPPPPRKPKETFGATGHKDDGEIGMVCRRKSCCTCGKCFTCKSVV